MEFDWHDAKAEKVARERGITFLEASSVFEDKDHIRRDDIRHSIVEKRELLIGRSHNQRVLFVSFTMRDTATWIITTRIASPKERRLYEQSKE